MIVDIHSVKPRARLSWDTVYTKVDRLGRPVWIVSCGYARHIHYDLDVAIAGWRVKRLNAQIRREKCD